MKSGWVPKVHRALQALTATMLISVATFLYHQITAPYRVRYYSAPASSLSSEQLTVYSTEGTSNPIFVSMDCKPAELTDLLFRPTLEPAREWSLREMIPSALASTAPFTKNSREPIEEVADRHISGGLADWEGLETDNLASRVNILVAEKWWQLSPHERVTIQKAFLALTDHHDTSSLQLPAHMTPDLALRFRNELDRVQQGWEEDVNAVGTNLLVRWQSLTGTTLLAPFKGIGGGTPVFLSLPPLKPKSGAIMTVAERNWLTDSPKFALSAGDEQVYEALSAEELKLPSYLLALYNHPQISAMACLALTLLGWFAWRVWRWPKNLTDVQLLRSAQSLDQDELWAELRKRHSWTDRYITEQFIKTRSGLPTQEVLNAFWRVLSETLREKPVTPVNDIQVRQTLFRVLDQALLDALR